jgi:hypothetical protein
MDNDYQFALDELLRLIRDQEVMLIRFVIVPKRLLFDARFSELEGPVLKLVPRASSPQDRFRELRRLRPRFSLPERLTVIAWPKFVESLVTTGVWAEIEGRLGRSGFPGALQQAASILQELQSLERAERRNAIRGDGYRSYWDRGP